ncbi:aminoglycoside adenylyltransferase domain-containing protein [Nocardia sp. NPDC057353]|uniref:aminoglycoside adenylyltransferase domain-containing protein n=1 Tax=Nocardia sp. NPDC057353 TaxID=3346104 RepID=UPI0036273700
MESAVEAVCTEITRRDLGGVAGVYLYGSAAAGGLRPDSDVDLLVLTRRSLTDVERTALVAVLLRVSGWRGHATAFPDATGRRPLESTVLTLDQVRPVPPAPRVDFQFGEWLRADLVRGALPRPVADPDAVVLLATALAAHRVLAGPALADLVAPIPPQTLRRALIAVVPGIVAEMSGDERNAVLTLARILVTLASGRIVAKDEAAATVARTLPPPDRALLESARACYLTGVDVDWDAARARNLAHALAARVPYSS